MELKVILGMLVMAAVAVGANAAVNCTQTGAGRFADTNDPTCQNYTLCVFDSTTSTYTSYNYTCPTTSVFNPNSHLCTSPTGFVCNNTATTTPSSICTEDGYIADPDSTDCSSYIECVEVNGVYTETNYTCPSGTLYNPDSTLCEADYTCGFTCTSAGRFADASDSTCQNYYFCVLAANGTYIQYLYTCPSTSLFNPNTSVCTANYTCP